MRLWQYIPGDSLVHRLDPRVKIGFTLTLSVSILRGGALTGGIISAFLIALLLISELRLRSIAEAFRPVLLFLALLFFVHLLFTGGDPIPPFPRFPVTVTYEGLSRGASTTWQFALLILSASILTMTTPAMELVSGIERLLRPFGRIGVPSHDLAMMVSIAMRFVPTFLEEIDRIKMAQAARGASFASGSVARRTRAAASILVPLLVQTVKRANGLVTAMESRCYRRGPRTYLRELTLRRSDYRAILFMTLMAGLLLFVT